MAVKVESSDRDPDADPPECGIARMRTHLDAESPGCGTDRMRNTGSYGYLHLRPDWDPGHLHHVVISWLTAPPDERIVS